MDEIKFPRRTKKPKCAKCKFSLNIENFALPCGREDWSIGPCPSCKTEINVMSYVDEKESCTRYVVLDCSKTYYGWKY